MDSSPPVTDAVSTSNPPVFLPVGESAFDGPGPIFNIHHPGFRYFRPHPPVYKAPELCLFTESNLIEQDHSSGSELEYVSFHPSCVRHQNQTGSKADQEPTDADGTKDPDEEFGDHNWSMSDFWKGHPITDNEDMEDWEDWEGKEETETGNRKDTQPVTYHFGQANSKLPTPEHIYNQTKG